MPTYEYSCSSCDTRHEVQQKMADASLTDCPACGRSGLRKLFTNVGVVFKGSGFYRTDSRDKASSGAASGSSSGAASDSASSAGQSGDSSSASTGTRSSDSSAGSKSDSKPGSTPDSKSGSKPGSTSGSTSASRAPAAAPA
ncbi:MAG: FmdB family zinc ribbon protein [Candidatus Nanopelagicales bacterium]